MISNGITVISKRFNDDKEPSALIFREGLKLRPLLSKNNLSQIGQMSTSVQLRVSAEKLEAMTTVGVDHFSDKRVIISLDKLVAHVCPCLDCDVYTDDGSGKLILAHSMNWFEEEPTKWLRDVTLADALDQPEFSDYLAGISNNLQLIKDASGVAIGRAAIGHNQFKVGFGCIGGLTEGLYSRNTYQFTTAYAGVLRKTANGPRRDQGSLDGLETFVAKWASEQAEVLHLKLDNAPERYFASRNVAAYGGDPTPVATILLNRRPESLDFIFNTLNEKREIYAAIEFQLRADTAFLSLVRHRVTPGFTQTLDYDEIDFRENFIIEGHEPYLSDGKRYHRVDENDRCSFISCLARHAKNNERTLQTTIVDDYPIVIYTGEASKKLGLTPGMAIKMPALRLCLV